MWHPPPSAVPGEVARAWGSLTSERQLARQFLKRHQNDVYDVAWSPCSSRLITGSVDNSCIVWDVARGREIATLEGHSHYVQGVAWDPAGAFLVSQSSDRSMRVYRENTPLAQAHCKGKRSVAKVMTQIARAGGIGTKLYVCVQAIKALGILNLVECGPGKVLAGMVKRIDAEMTGSALFDPASLEEVKGVLA